jgi:hypothetical protein
MPWIWDGFQVRTVALIPTTLLVRYFSLGVTPYYSDANTTALAIALEQMTGKTWNQAIRDLVMKPWSLSESFFLLMFLKTLHPMFHLIYVLKNMNISLPILPCRIDH